jgi:hypothetical protein
MQLDLRKRFDTVVDELNDAIHQNKESEAEVARDKLDMLWKSVTDEERALMRRWSCERDTVIHQFDEMSESCIECGLTHGSYAQSLVKDRCRHCKAIEEKIKEWINKQGHDSCWYYPEIFREICKELDIDPNIIPTIPQDEFDKGCKRYQDELFNGGKP